MQHSSGMPASRALPLAAVVRWGAVRRALLIALAAAAPAIATLLLVEVHMGAAMTDFVPAINDEVSYWHQILTFKTVGFAGGYYTINDIPAPAAFTHFFAYGPWHPMLFGGLAAIFGWEVYSAPLYNLALVAVGLAVFCLWLKLDDRQVLVLAALMLTFWPALLFLFSNMQESLHQFIAIILAGIFAVTLRHGHRLPLGWKLIFLAFIFGAAILRMSWGMLFLPFFILIARRQTLAGWVLATLRSILVIVIVVAIFAYTGAPAHMPLFGLMGEFTMSIVEGIASLLRYVASNLAAFFDFSRSPLEVLLRMQTVVAILAALGALVWRRRRGLAEGQAEFALHAFNLIGIVFASVTLYIVGNWGDYRVIAVHMLLSAMLLLARRRLAPVLALIALNGVFLPVALSEYPRVVTPNLTPDRAAMAEFRAAASAIQYDPDAPSAWCNTLLFYGLDYTYQMTGVPGGIGLSFFIDPDEPRLRFHSGYLLLSDAMLERIQQRADAPELMPIAVMPTGTLYRSLSANCDG